MAASMAPPYLPKNNCAICAMIMIHSTTHLTRTGYIVVVINLKPVYIDIDDELLPQPIPCPFK